MILARDIRRNAWIVAVAVAFPAAELISAADVDVLFILAEIVVRDCAHKITTQQFIAGSKEMRHVGRGVTYSRCARGGTANLSTCCTSARPVAASQSPATSAGQSGKTCRSLSSPAHALGSAQLRASCVQAGEREKTAGMLCARTNWIAFEQLMKVLSRTMLRLPPPISTPTSQSSNVLLTLIGDPF